jgi:hypothetical protein
VHTRFIGTEILDRDLGGAKGGDDRATIAREVGIVCLAAFVYFGVRLLVEGDASSAAANADRILRFEGWLGIDLEEGAQDLVLDRPVLRGLGNASYVWLHWPLLIVVLVVVYHRDLVTYVRLRRALLISGACGLVLFWLMPTAPPRFVPGFEGTVSDAARTHYLGYPLGWANQFASFPSFHVGWTLIACIALAATIGSRVARAVALVPGLLVGVAVVTTGNHYVLDVAVGVVLAVGAYVAAAHLPAARPDRRAD